MNISRLIMRKLREEHKGRNRAIKRYELLHWLCSEGAYRFPGNDSDDREMRAIIETMPIICSCETGYYLAREGEKGDEDVKYAIKYIEKKAMPLLVKIRRKKEAHPQFYGERNQGDLFDED